MVYAFRDAADVDPIDNDTAESLLEFYASRELSGRRALVMHIGPGQWSLRGQVVGGAFLQPLPMIRKDVAGYCEVNQNVWGTRQPTLLDAIDGALSGY